MKNIIFLAFSFNTIVCGISFSVGSDIVIISPLGVIVIKFKFKSVATLPAELCNNFFNINSSCKWPLVVEYSTFKNLISPLSIL